MRTPRLFYLCTSILLLCCSFSAAWPWPPLNGLIQARQENDKGPTPTSTQDSAAQTSPAAETSDESKGTESAAASASGSSPASASASASASGTITDKPQSTDGSEASASESGDNSGKGSKATKTNPGGKSNKTAAATSAIDPRLPGGGISMITPAVTLGPQYYRVGLNVTFAWNYTNLLVTPEAIDIMATCTQNDQLYTIATNQSFGSSSVTWDTNKFQTAPFPVATYQLVIYDAEAGISATPEAGHLGLFNSFSFGMYTARPYSNYTDFSCPTCLKNGAVSEATAQAFKLMLGMATVTVLSFACFLGSFGLF